MPIVQISPRTAEAEKLRGKKLYEAAQPLYREAIKQDDNDVIAWAGLGFCSWRLNQSQEAEIAFRVALGLNPVNDTALFAFIEMLMSHEKLGPAETFIKHAEKYFGECPEVWISKGNLALKKYQPALAEKHFRKILNQRPRDGAAWMSLGSAKMYQHQPKEALDCYKRAINFDPQADFVFNLGLAQLLTGDYVNGFENYEASAQAFPHKYYTKHPQEKRWEGQPCKKLLLVHAHGLGDLIFVSRFFDRLPPFVLEVEWWQEKMFPGIETSKRFYEGEYDYWIGEDSLAGVIKGRPCDPVDTVKLTDLEKQAARNLLGDKPAISLTWRGNSTYRNDLHRSIDLIRFKELIESHPEYQFINLSTEDYLAEEVEKSGLPIRQIKTDIRQSMAILSQCKKIVSVDTSHIHIGGVLGVPTVLMNRWLPDWRWGLEGEKCVWYPSVQIIRQSEPGRWDDVISKVKL